MGIVEQQLEELQREFPGASAEVRGDGSTLVSVPNVSLPAGWNRSQTLVQFIAPLGFPMAQPDCFWAEEGLRLANGSIPKSAGMQTPVFGGPAKLWFSWHVGSWNGSRDTLRSYVAVIMSRLQRPE